jgi:uncharacterized protein (DUF983 family)
MKNIQSKLKFLLDIINEKCPKCAQGHVFNNKLSLMKLPVMSILSALPKNSA